MDRYCPLMLAAAVSADRSVGAEECMCFQEECAWHVGNGCAMAYIGANCKSNITPWRSSDGR